MELTWKPWSLAGLKTSTIYTARRRKEAGLYNMKKGTEVANRCADIPREVSGMLCYGPFRQKGRWDRRREAWCPRQPWEGWQGSHARLCIDTVVVKVLSNDHCHQPSGQVDVSWLCEHLHWFVTKVGLEEIALYFKSPIYLRVSYPFVLFSGRCWRKWPQRWCGRKGTVWWNAEGCALEQEYCWLCMKLEAMEDRVREISQTRKQFNICLIKIDRSTFYPQI